MAKGVAYRSASVSVMSSPILRSIRPVKAALPNEGKRQADAVQALKFHGMSWSMLEIGQP